MWSRPQYTDLTYMGGTGPCSLELVYKPKYQIWCESDVPCAQDPSLPIFNTNQRMGNRSLWANFQVCSSLCSNTIVFTTDGHTDGRTDRQI